MSLRQCTPCDCDGICPYDAMYGHDCEYWCGADEPEYIPAGCEDDYEDEPSDDHLDEHITTVRNILDDHCILTSFYDGKLFALENAGKDSKLLDVTNWSINQIYDWLGYDF